LKDQNYSEHSNGASTSASDTDVKEFAAKTLPTLKEHLELAKTLNGTKSTGMKTGALQNRSLETAK
jgi:hypothetical protein